MDHRLKNCGEIGAGDKMMQLMADMAFYLTSPLQLFIVTLRLADLKFYQFMDVVFIFRPGKMCIRDRS